METIINFINNNKELCYLIFGALVLIAFIIIIFFVLDFIQSKKTKAVKPVIIDEKEKENAKLELEKIMKQMTADMENREPINITSYEQDQEEKAIISYEELVKAAKRTVESADIIDNESEDKENYLNTVRNSLVFEGKDDENIINKVESEVNDAYIQTALELDIKEDAKFKNTEFISPIFGKISNEISYPKIEEFESNKPFSKLSETFSEISAVNDYELIKESFTLEQLDNEIKRNTDFLNTLKEFRKNLQ